MASKNNKQKIKIRRSNGKIQEVTFDELDKLNQARKIRDQNIAYLKFTPENFNRIGIAIFIVACLFFTVFYLQ